MKNYPNFTVANSDLVQQFKTLALDVHSEFWQGTRVKQRPEAAMKELLNVSFQVGLGNEDLDHWRQDIWPNLPWADDHFEKERVSGRPINPGETWKQWPYALSADKYQEQHGGKFNHTYAERFWPRFAGTPGHDPETLGEYENTGIRYRYADLNDVIEAMIQDPWTRQAYVPIWFPEDGSHMDRKPCTLGYHFIMRRGYLHTTYYIRSCDFIRHFKDDCYLTIRLTLWLLNALRQRDGEFWDKVKPGIFTMHIVSLHCFINDYRQIVSGSSSRL